MITPAVTEAITAADVVVGYCGYMAFIEHIIPGQAVRISSGMTQEVRRAEKAFVLAREGKSVVVVSSGDAGIYGMAPLIMEMYAKAESDDVDVEVLPGISAFQAAAARLGAPISHDFCVISLSDLMTPWEKIEARINAAASADFVTAVYNPKKPRPVLANPQVQGDFHVLKPGKTYDEVYNSFRWEIPEFYNIGVDICDKWAHQRYRLALIYEDENGQVEKYSF